MESVVKSLIERGAQVVAIVRHETERKKISELQSLGAQVRETDFENQTELASICTGSACVVSALSGLREVIVNGQTTLLKAAVEAGVPRFIPSDFSADFTKLPAGLNRNFDLRREFHEVLSKYPIAATTIFNGAFTELLIGQAPFILFGLKRVLFWQNADQVLDFTSIKDVAAFTALAALDASTPRYLFVAGDQFSARELVQIVSDVTGKQFRLIRGGGLTLLGRLIKLVRFMKPGKNEVFPPWQGMQYMHNMYSGVVSVSPVDNHRYPGMRWSSAKDILIARAR